MRYLLIIPLCILAVSKVTLQSGFSKKNVQTPVDALFFNAMIFLSAAALSAPVIFREISLSDFAWGAAFGFFSVLFQLFYCFALRYGPVSITVLTVNCSMIVPVCFSVLFFNEQLTLCRVIGIVTVILAFILNTEMTKGRKHSIVWIVSALTAFAANSGCSIVQKSFTVISHSGDKAEFVAAAYLCAAVMSFVIIALFRVKKANITYKVTVKVCITALTIGGILFSFQLLNTYAVSIIDGTVLYPVYNGGSTLLSTFVGLLFFREKMSVRQTAGMISGIIGIVLLCL